MSTRFQLSKSVDVEVEKDPEGAGTVVLSHSIKEEKLRFDLNDWEAFFREHNRINNMVHKRWRGEKIEDPSVFWEGLPLTLEYPNTQLEGALKTLLNLKSEVDYETLRDKLQDLLDERLNAVRIGKYYRVELKHSGKDTQVHFFTYSPHGFLIFPLFHLSFDGWLKLYKHFLDINELMGITRHEPVV